jgi:glycosyltransferase involved in cell wall biosynthesis
MLFTIVTPSLKQGFAPNQLEHWVIDGGSKDDTLAILKAEPNVKWISEPDKGLSDAVNKGIQRASGDWIIWLNADDLLANDALKTFLEYTHRHTDVRIFEGGQIYLRYDGTPEQTVPGSAHRLEDVLGTETGMNQASMFVHREVYEKAGLLDITVRYAMDYEWLVRAMHHYKCVPIKEVLTYYRRREGSIMDAHMAKHFRTFLDVRRRYRQPRLCRAEFRLLFYIYTDRLRRISWLRRCVRHGKGLFGMKPIHPMS